MNKKILSFFLIVTAMVCGSQFVQAQKTKSELVNDLVELTVLKDSFPEFENQFDTMPKNPQKLKILMKNYAERFDEALDQNGKLTSEQKIFVKTNYFKLSETLRKKLAQEFKNNWKFNDFMKEVLEQSYSQKLNDSELNRLIIFFEKPAGQSVIKFLNFLRLIDRKNGKPIYKKHENREYDKFAKTPLGDKFLGIFRKETQVYLDPKMREAFPKQFEESFMTLDSEDLNKFINEFVATNYKK